MTPDEVQQLHSSLLGKKVVVMDAAAWAMTICTVKQVRTTGENLALEVEGGDTNLFELFGPVEVKKTETGYQLISEKQVLNVDFMPE